MQADLHPSELNLPFESFRRVDSRRTQFDIILELATSATPTTILSAPTGVGKSAIYYALSQINGGRTLFTSITKSLQEQLRRDHPDIVDIRGAGNYPCRDVEGLHNCDNGKCLVGERCEWRERGCDYYDQRALAARSERVVTNLDYRMYTNRYSNEPLGQFDTLVIDEAHNVVDRLSDFASVVVSPQRYKRVLGIKTFPSDKNDLLSWAAWASNNINTAHETNKEVQRSHRRDKPRVSRVIDQLIVELKQISSMPDSSPPWIIDNKVNRGSTTFTPLWPSKFFDQYLVCGTPKTILTSATIAKSVARYLGLDEDSHDYIEAGDGFDPRRRPFYYYPYFQHRGVKIKGARIGYKTSTDEWRRIIDNFDEFMGPRLALGRNGIIHGVSYERCKMIAQMSKHRDKLLTHTSRNTEDVVSKLSTHRGDVGIAVVSPSIEEGRNFAHDDCRWQIIAKVPFRPNNEVSKVRNKETKRQYSNSVACGDIMQMCGRPCRAPDDWCETIIFDCHMDWFWPTCVRNGDVPRWFARGYKRVNSMPKPLEVSWHT